MRASPALLAATLAGAVLGLIIALAPGAVADKPTAPAATALAPAAPAAPSPVDAVRRTPVVEAVQRVAPAVVSITTEVPVNDPFARYWGAPTTSSSEGSGVVIEADGLVLTNAHVVARASRIQASFADGRSYEADILGLAEELDLAVLRLRDASGLTTVEIGSSADLMLGEPVIAIGNPFGLGHTVTTGVLSATRRSLQTEQRVYQDFLQTDASINPGNSGGPLLDVRGRLIGVNTAIRSDAQGIGFAIPVDRAIKVAQDLSRYGRVQLPWLGVDLQDVSLSDGSARASRTAARVSRAYGEAGGLQEGDIILSVAGRTVSGRGDLNAWLAGEYKAGEVSLRVRRGASSGAQELDVRVTPGTLPQAVVESSIQEVLGVRIPDGDHRTGLPVVAVSPAGAYARVGGRAGDLLTSLDGAPLSSADELRTAISSAKSAHRGDALLTVRRGNAQFRVKMPL